MARTRDLAVVQGFFAAPAGEAEGG
jgi:hypothetical protein